MKKLYLLLGPKGAGKSYISALMETEWGIKFFRVEDIWLELERARMPKVAKVNLGRQRILAGLEKLFEKYDSLSIESTGMSDHFEKFVNELRRRYDLVVIKVLAQTQTCMTRIKNRDAGRHVHYVSEELLRLDKVVREKEFGSDLVINNDGVTEESLKEAIEMLLESKGFEFEN